METCLRYYRSLFTSFPPRKRYDSILYLLKDLISSFRPSALNNPPRRMSCTSNNLETGNLVEDVYCYELYRSAFQVLEGDWLWSPQFGTRGVLKSGCIDFYIGHTK